MLARPWKVQRHKKLKMESLKLSRQLGKSLEVQRPRL